MKTLTIRGLFITLT